MILGICGPSVCRTKGAGAAELILDSITGATAAYSLRKLKTAYTGNCIKVRRSSDNTELDIGFNGTSLDTAAVTTFVGAGSGYISVWYDQSGASKDMTQATAIKQPLIVSSGTLFVHPGSSKVALDYSVSGMGLGSTNALTSGSYTISAVYAAKGGNRAINGSNNFLMGAYQNGNYTAYVGTGFTGNSVVFVNNKIITQTLRCESGIGAVNYVNTTNAGSIATFGFPGNVNTGAVGGIAESHFGSVSEVITFASAISLANRSALEASQISYYSIT